jgi:hypothetical protein
MEATIAIYGLEAALEMLAFQPQIVEPELHDAAEASLMGVRRPAMEYPPEPAGSTYTRTLTLGRTWAEALPEWEADKAHFEASIGNPTPYGPYVMDEEEQAWMHVGRWRTADDILRDAEPQIAENFERALVQIARKLDGIAR